MTHKDKPPTLRDIRSKFLSKGARVYLGLVSIIASRHKIMDPETFALGVAAYQSLPLWAIDGFALKLPWMELLTGAMLILGLRARAAAQVVLFMMLSFSLFPIGRLVYETNDLHLDSDGPCYRYSR